MHPPIRERRVVRRFPSALPLLDLTRGATVVHLRLVYLRLPHPVHPHRRLLHLHRIRMLQGEIHREVSDVGRTGDPRRPSGLLSVRRDRHVKIRRCVVRLLVRSLRTVLSPRERRAVSQQRRGEDVDCLVFVRVSVETRPRLQLDAPQLSGVPSGDHVLLAEGSVAEV